MFELTEKIELPQQEIESLARCLLPDILSFYETEKGRIEFEKWKQNHED